MNKKFSLYIENNCCIFVAELINQFMNTAINILRYCPKDVKTSFPRKLVFNSTSAGQPYFIGGSQDIGFRHVGFQTKSRVANLITNPLTELLLRVTTSRQGLDEHFYSCFTVDNLTRVVYDYSLRGLIK